MAATHTAATGAGRKPPTRDGPAPGFPESGASCRGSSVMRRGFIRGVLIFGAVAATAFTAYVGVVFGKPWPELLRTWLLLFGALALAPLGMSLLSLAAWAARIGRREAVDGATGSQRDR